MNVMVNLPETEQEVARFNDDYLAFLWNVAQHNPASIEDEMAGRVAELIGREIIRRWLKGVSPEVWHHQGRHYYWSILAQHGRWLSINGDENNRKWVPEVVAVPTESGAEPHYK